MSGATGEGGAHCCGQGGYGFGELKEYRNDDDDIDGEVRSLRAE